MSLAPLLGAVPSFSRLPPPSVIKMRCLKCWMIVMVMLLFVHVRGGLNPEHEGGGGHFNFHTVWKKNEKWPQTALSLTRGRNEPISFTCTKIEKSGHIKQLEGPPNCFQLCGYHGFLGAVGATCVFCCPGGVGGGGVLVTVPSRPRLPVPKSPRRSDVPLVGSDSCLTSLQADCNAGMS